jgi:hypothetical protein
VPVPADKKKKVIDEAFSQTRAMIAQRHEELGRRVYGWARNTWNQTFQASKAGKAATAGAAASKVLSYIPVVGSFASFAADTLVGVAKSKYLTSQVGDRDKMLASTGNQEEQMKMSGEFIVTKGAQDVADAVRKVTEAQKEVQKLYEDDKLQGKNCKTFLDFIYASLYLKYRMGRLEMYLGIMQAYTQKVQEQLDQMNKQWPKIEQDIHEAGMERLDDFWFHQEWCKGNPTCLYQMEWLQIGGPTNVQIPQAVRDALGRNSIPAGPGATLPGAAIPGAPPLPPRPGRVATPAPPPLPPRPGRR